MNRIVSQKHMTLAHRKGVEWRKGRKMPRTCLLDLREKENGCGDGIEAESKDNLSVGQPSQKGR
jgi:hypothetical protein